MTQQGKERERIFRSVEAYIQKRYLPKKAHSIVGVLEDISRAASTGQRGVGAPSPGFGLDGMNKILDALTSKAEKTFAERLLFLMERSGKAPVDIYTKAGITKQHFYKIKSNPDYKPTKETALAFAIALRLPLDEAKDLIGRAGYTLSRSSKSDIIVEYFLREGIYDVDELNYNLDVRGFGTLTNRRNTL